jgi:hypothetical protein
LGLIRTLLSNIRRSHDGSLPYRRGVPRCAFAGIHCRHRVCVNTRRHSDHAQDRERHARQQCLCGLDGEGYSLSGGRRSREEQRLERIQVPGRTQRSQLHRSRHDGLCRPDAAVERHFALHRAEELDVLAVLRRNGRFARYGSRANSSVVIHDAF